MSRDRGLTLVEVLVTIAILSTIALTLYGVIITTYRVVDRLGGRMERQRALMGLYEVLSADIRGAYLQEGDPSTLFKGGPPPEGLSITTFTPYQPEGMRRMVRVDYRVVEGDSLVRTLYTRKGKMVDSTTLMEGIMAFEMAFVKEGRVEERWDPSMGLPEAVVVRIETGDGGSILSIRVR